MRKKDELRALGPYEVRGKWRVVFRGPPDSTHPREDQIFDNYKDALAERNTFNKIAQQKAALSLERAIEQHIAQLAKKGRRATSTATVVAPLPLLTRGAVS